eukprot:364549-Chlamydomonas_euryale.AAC.4
MTTHSVAYTNDMCRRAPISSMQAAVPEIICRKAGNYIVQFIHVLWTPGNVGTWTHVVEHCQDDTL